MKKLKICYIALFVLLTASVFNISTSYASEIDEAISKAKRENKMLFLVCGEPNGKKAKRINSWIKSKKIRLSKKVFTYKLVTIGTVEQKEQLMSKFDVAEIDKGPFVCIADQNGNEFKTIKGLKPLNEYKKLVKQAKKHFKEMKLEANRNK